MGINKSSTLVCPTVYNGVADVVFLFEGEGEENTMIDKVTSVSPDIRRAEQIEVTW